MSQPTISQRLHDELSIIIAEARPGDRLPSEPKLARQLGVSRATLREAMRTFETQGLIRRKQGSGTYVTHPAGVIESGLEILESIETLAKRNGMVVCMKKLDIQYCHAEEEDALALNISPGNDIVRITRIIYAEERPVAHLTDILPKDIVQPKELENEFTGSVFDLLLQRGTPKLSTAQTDINAVPASPEVARALGIQRGDVLLRFLSSLHTDTGQIIAYATSYFLPGYFRFHINRRVS